MIRFPAVWFSTALVVLCILVPFFLFEQQVSAFSARLTSSSQGLTLGVLTVAAILASDVVLPVPSSVVSVLAGKSLGFLPALIAIWLGMSIGAAVGYWLGSRGRSFLLSPARRAEVDAFNSKIKGKGWLYIALSRPVPVLSESCAILAGAIGFDREIFFRTVAISNLGVAGVYAAIGTLGASGYMFWIAVTASIIFPAVSQLVFYYRFSK